MPKNTINKTNALKIDGMTCINCAINLENSVKKAGLENVHVNFANKELIYEEVEQISLPVIEKAIKNAGYSLANENKKNPFLLKFITGFSFSVAIYFILIMFIPIHVPPLIDLVLAGISLTIGFYKFGKGAFYSLKAGSANMYVLILLGATTAFIFSIYLMIFKTGAHLYFETTAVLIALVIIGDIIEDKAIQKTVAAISNLAQNKVSQAKKIVDNNIVLSSINSLKTNDLIQGSLGDEIYTDSIITEGNALVDESLITGESLPITKSIGDSLIGGSQIIEGNIIYQVTKSANLSTKAKINKMVQDASSKKANVQKLADKIAAIFVPTIIFLSILVFLLNFYALQVGFEAAILRSIAVLVISCPCAMGLATPISIMVGLDKMSSEGILVKTPNVFENFAAVKQIIFDKTGTLTTGEFTTSNFIAFNIDEYKAKQIIKSIEQKSSHPIAKSIVKKWEDVTSIELLKINEIQGKGMAAEDGEGNSYLLGSASFTNQNENEADLFLLQNNILIAQLNINDELKENAKETINYFKANNINSIILSGDKAKKCAVMQNTLSTEVIGDLKPEDKLQKIQDYNNLNTAMVGDGVNDAPSLAKVNVGISFANASNMAMQSADVILMQSNMEILQKAHKIALLTYKTIQQNLFWAFSYNLIAIPLAAFGIINPMLAAFFMIFSDLVVVGNAFLLKGKKI